MSRTERLRARFEAAHPFPLDDFQRDALDALDAGRSVLVAAPTGAGKTLVAEYAIAAAIDSGTKTFYTTPLKALSNQKYGDFVRLHGAANVGLLTGDNVINGDAPIVVMTTEVLRNMIYAQSSALDRLRYAVLDEVHYLQDRTRGAVWEEVIIHLPPEIAIVALSATVSNAEEVAAWMQTVRGETETVIEERRPVELRHLYMVGERGTEGLHLLPTFVDDAGELRPNPVAARLDGRGPARGPKARRPRLYKPWRTEVVDRLADERMLPAIVFVFSRAGCDQAVEQCLAGGIRLTDAAARRELRRIADAHLEALDDADLEALGYDEWLAGLEAGIAAHHAGMVPPMKEAVEEAFAAGLLQVVFATETLSLGINMPARSVVVEKLTKFTGEHHELLTPGEYTQLAGRAGRRGIDDVGYAVVLWDPFVSFDQVAGLASRRTYALTSSFRATYNMAANLVQRYERDEARRLLDLSFAQFHADRDAVSLARHLERTRGQLARAREAARHSGGDVDEYRALLAQLDDARRAAHQAQGSRLDALRPGDVVVAPRRGGRAVVLKQERGRSGNRVLALTQQRTMVRLTADDFRGPVRRLANVELPRPFAPRSPTFQKATVALLRRLPEAEPGPDDADARVEEIQARVHAHPLHGAPGTDAAAPQRRGRPTASPARSSVWSAGSRGAPRRSPGSSTACSRCWSRGATSATGSCCRAAGCCRGSTRSATSSSPRRSRPACSTVSIRPTSPRSSRASCTSGAARTATSPCRPGAGRRRWSASAPPRSSGCGATCTSPSATNGCGRPGGPIPASRPRSMRGWRATTWPTSSRTRR